MYDFVIIGAGINGSFIAHHLAHLSCKVAVIDKEEDVANGASMANSAIVHAGYDPEEGSKKAVFNVQGSRMYEGICGYLHASYKRTSAYVVATNDEEESQLIPLYDNAIRRGIPVSYVEKEELRRKEPNLSDTVQRALEFPTTAVIYPWEVAYSLMEEAVENGVSLYLSERVTAIEGGENYTIHTDKCVLKAKYVINAAGVYADNIYAMLTKHPYFTITPRKGEYFVLDRLAKPFVHRVIYPLPSKEGKGILAVPTVHGNVLLGPNSFFTDDKEGINTTQEGMDYVRSRLSKTLKNIPMQKVIRNFAGLRPSGTKDEGPDHSGSHDFIVEESKEYKNFINVACMESPGLASAPAVARYVTEELIQADKHFSKKRSLSDVSRFR